MIKNCVLTLRTFLNRTAIIIEHSKTIYLTRRNLLTAKSQETKTMLVLLRSKELVVLGLTTILKNFYKTRR